MPDPSAPPGPPPQWWRRMLRDVQFWIPLAVLMGGLLLLRWVA